MILFLLDGTKQLLSSGLLHITNIAFSVVIGSTQNDQCGIYLMTFVVDISLGILICYYLLKLVDKILSYRKSKVLSFHQKLKSGNYFTKVQLTDGSLEVNIDYFVWFEQTAIWLLIVLVVAAVYADEAARHRHSNNFFKCRHSARQLEHADVFSSSLDSGMPRSSRFSSS